MKWNGIMIWWPIHSKRTATQSAVSVWLPDANILHNHTKLPTKTSANALIKLNHDFDQTMPPCQNVECFSPPSSFSFPRQILFSREESQTKHRFCLSVCLSVCSSQKSLETKQCGKTRPIGGWFASYDGFFFPFMLVRDYRDQVAFFFSPSQRIDRLRTLAMA